MKRWLLVLVTVLTATSGTASAPLSAGKWLVDLGRDYPLSAQAGLSDVDAEITLLFMQAAARVEPALAEAYRWQVDLLQVLGREREAADALRAYIGYAPEDIPAHLTWISLSVAALQTAEERSAFCREHLQRSDLPPEVTSELHCRQADFYWNRGDSNRAIQHAEAALRADAQNLAARTMLAELRPEREPVVQRIAIMLTQLEMSPGDAVLAKQLGDELALLGMGLEADRWYRHAEAVRTLSEPGPTPVALLLAWASALMEAGRLEEAEALARQAIRLDPKAIEPMLLRATVALLQDDVDSAVAHLQRVRETCNMFLESGPEQLDPGVRAEIAWLFAHYVELYEKAETQARQALRDYPESIVAQRALGTALRENERLDEARRVLTAVADVDLWSAIELARAHYDAEQKDLAAEQLRSAATQPATFEQRHTIKELMDQWEVGSPATQPALTEIKALLDAFPDPVLDYPLHPERYLSLGLHLSGSNMPPAEPWRCTVRLDNIGPFPITIGPEMMVEPELFCLVKTRGDRSRSSGPTVRISLQRRLKLAPGESLTLTQTLDIGAIRSGMIGTPQVSHEVEVSAIVNPVVELGPDDREVWGPGVGGLRARPVRFRRVPFVVKAEEVRALLARSRAPETDDRIVGMEVLAMLLAEHQHLAAGRLRYAARPIDPAAVQAAVLARADDPDWRVRARLAECLRWFVLDQAAMQTVARLLNDPHWLVRGLARRILADQPGRKFESVLKTSARSNPDDWVRRLSEALLGRLSLAASTAGAASSPSTAPAAGGRR